MTPRQALAICELSALAPRQDVTHSAAKVVVPNTMPLSKQRMAFACTCKALFSGVSNRARAFFLLCSTAFGSENCFKVSNRARFLASGLENCFIAAFRSFVFTSGRFITSEWRSAWAFLYSGSENRSLAFWLRFCLHFKDQRRSRCFCFVSSETMQPDAPSPPSVRLHKPSSLYLMIKSRSSSKAHHSCIPDWTISTV